MAPRHNPNDVPHGDDIEPTIETEPALTQKTPMDRLMRLRMFCGVIDLNPTVTLLAAGGLSAMTWYALTYTINTYDIAVTLSEWSEWITDEWTWFMIGSRNVFVGVILYLLLSKYRHIKLGKDDDEPEYSFGSWFAMLFTCGVATRLWYYTAESVWHYKGTGGRFNDLPDNERAVHSIMVTWFHWGLHGWIAFTIVGALLAIMTYRRGMPMTMRFCFYPLIGDRVYGWIGELVDIVSVVVTLLAVGSSLGLGVRQIYKGLVRIDSGTYRGVDTISVADSYLGITTAITQREMEDLVTLRQVSIIGVITLISTISAASGVKHGGGVHEFGIKKLAQLALVLMSLVWLCLLFLGDAAYILNVITEATGRYFFFLPKISFITNALALLGPAAATTTSEGIIGGIGGANDGKGGDADWIGVWTMFYWGWWISWGPFVGTFMAKISKGRTLGQFITCSLIAPALAAALFLGVWGAEGIRLQNMADTEGLTCASATSPFSTVSKAINLNCLSTEDMLFDQISVYGGKELSMGLSIAILLAIVLAFATTSDSASLAVTMMASNGTAPVIQRVFWGLAEGAIAALLLYYGNTVDVTELTAARTITVVCGLPFTFFLLFICQALYYVCMEEAGDLDAGRSDMRSFITNIDHTNEGKLSSYIMGIIKIVVAIPLPCLQLSGIANQVWGSWFNGHWLIVTFISEGIMVGLVCIAYMDKLIDGAKSEYQCVFICGAVYLLFTAFMATLRNDVRIKVGCERGDFVTDFIICALAFPLAVPQMAAELAAHNDNDATVTPSNVEIKEPAETTRFPTPTKKPRPPGTITSEDRRPSFGRKASDRKLPGAAGRAASQQYRV